MSYLQKLATKLASFGPINANDPFAASVIPPAAAINKPLKGMGPMPAASAPRVAKQIPVPGPKKAFTALQNHAFSQAAPDVAKIPKMPADLTRPIVNRAPKHYNQSTWNPPAALSGKATQAVSKGMAGMMARNAGTAAGAGLGGIIGGAVARGNTRKRGLEHIPGLDGSYDKRKRRNTAIGAAVGSGLGAVAGRGIDIARRFKTAEVDDEALKRSLKGALGL